MIKITDVENAKTIEVTEEQKNDLVNKDLIFYDGTDWRTDNFDAVELELPKFYIDVPPTEGGDEWHNVATFKTREEAIKFAQEKFGADENGMVCLLSVS